MTKGGDLELRADVVLRPGAGDPPGAIRFTDPDGTERLRLDENGVYVLGARVTDVQHVYDALVGWLSGTAWQQCARAAASAERQAAARLVGRP